MVVNSEKHKKNLERIIKNIDLNIYNMELANSMIDMADNTKAKDKLFTNKERNK